MRKSLDAVVYPYDDKLFAIISTNLPLVFWGSFLDEFCETLIKFYLWVCVIEICDDICCLG